MKQLTFVLMIFCIITLFAINVNAELYFNSFVQKDYPTNTTIQRNVYTVSEEIDLQRTWIQRLFNSPVGSAVFPVISTALQGGNRPVDIGIYAQTQNMPFNLTYGQIDWCNISLILYQTEINAQGEIVNTTITKESYYFTATPATQTIINKQLRYKDQLFVSATCHYTDLRSFYEGNILGGQITAHVPTFQCSPCIEQSVESLESFVASEDLQMQKSTEIYNFFQNIITYNYTFWLILSWLFKIGALFVGIMLIFAGAFFVYYLFKKLRSSI